MSVSNSTSATSKVKPTIDDKAEFFEELKDIFPESAVLTAVEIGMLDTSSSIRTSSQIVCKLPPSLTSLYSGYRSNGIAKNCDTIFYSDIMSISEAEASFLEQSTRLQSQSLLWHKH